MSPKLWLIMDELKNDVSSNKAMVEEFVYLMTELYTASNYTINTGTRTHGAVNVERPLMNWLAGTNEDDLRTIVTKELLSGGFTARTCFVFGVYDLGRRIPEVTYPDDYDEVFQHLCLRLWMLQKMNGPFAITTMAKGELDRWYMTRPAPEEELLYSAWKRQHDHLLKFSMVLCLADGGAQVIQYQHIMKAKQMVTMVYKNAELLVEIGTEGWDTKPSNEVARYMKVRKIVGHTEASKYFRSKRGMSATTFRRAIGDLVAGGMVKVDDERMGKAIVYVWIG